MAANETPVGQGDSRSGTTLPRALGTFAAGAIPVSVLAAVNAIPAALPAASLAALAFAAFGGTAMSLMATRGGNGSTGSRTLPDAAREEALSDALFAAHDQVQAMRAELDAFADLIVDSDCDGHVIFANEAFLKIYGDEVLGQPLAHMRPVDPADRFDATNYVTRLPGDAANSKRVIAWLDSNIAVADDTSARRSVGRDVTRFVETASALGAARDEAEQASAAKARFLAAVSHEIRTPLNGILGLAALLLDDDLTPAQRNHVQAVRQSGRTLASLIDEVLDFSRIEAGHLDLIDEDVSPHTIIRDVAELLAPRAHTKGLGLGTRIATDMPQAIRLDGGRLRQVVTNLAGNAIKFTGKGGIAIISAWKPGRRGKGTLIISVSDTGPGIAAGERARVFEEFEQVGNHDQGGTGLGLAITRQIIDAMGGSITLDSKRGKGTTFTVMLPCVMARETRSAQAPLDGLRISVKLASAIEAKCLKQVCVDLGATIVAAGRKADVCLTDKTTGRRSASKTRHIALLASTDKVIPDDLKARGFTGYLTRPIREESLVARIAAGAAGSVSPRPSSAPREDRLPRAGRCISILLAEDDPVSAMLMVAALQRMGHEVVHVRDGTSALKRLQSARPRFDVALLDIQLPGLDGYAIARAARAGHIETPLIAVTANAFPQDRAAALEAGFAAHMAKPVDPHRLALLLESVAGEPNAHQHRA